MEPLLSFYVEYGWQLTAIAFLGIVILGVLKYANVFSNISKEKRKPIYFAISIGFSLLSTIIYLLVIKAFELKHVLAMTIAIYAINQAMYAVYETTSLRDLIGKIGEILRKFIDKYLSK